MASETLTNNLCLSDQECDIWDLWNWIKILGDVIFRDEPLAILSLAGIEYKSTSSKFNVHL